MTIPQSLAKSIKARCAVPGEYRLAVRSKETFTQTGYRYTNSGIENINVKQVTGDFTWREAVNFVFDKKYPILSTVVSSFKVLFDIDQTFNNGQNGRRYYETENKSIRTFTINGQTVARNAFNRQELISLEYSTFNGAKVYTTDSRETITTRTVIEELYLVSCRCKNGDDIDCTKAPLGYCCIPYSLTTALCDKLNN